MIKVSIIIPVYNVEKYLKECLDSIFRQTLKEIEVVCVNDDSTDNSLKILVEYQKLHDNMQVITQENSGSGIARNTGIKIANGEYLMFVDPDDYLAADDVVEALYMALKSNDVAVCGGSLVYLKNGVLSRRFYGLTSKCSVQENGFMTFKDYQCPYGHCRYIISKDLLVKNNIYYPKYRRGQDVLFMASVLNVVDKFYLIKKEVYVYRKGHKEEEYTTIKVNDLIDEVYDTMVFAVNNNLSVLFDEMVKLANIYATKYWCKSIKENNTWDKIDRINNVIAQGNALFQYKGQAGLLMDEKEYNNYLTEIKKQMAIIEETIKNSVKFYIYGAGVWGKIIYKYLLNKGYKADGFVVSNAVENAKVVEGVPVVSVNELENAEEYLFVLGTLYQEIRAEMRRNLENIGYCNILEFDCTMLYNL